MALRADFAPAHTMSEEWTAAWDDLARHAAEPNPFLERWFVTPSLIHFPPGPDARAVTVWEDDRLIGFTLLDLSTRYGRLPVRHVANWLHYHAFVGTPLVREGHETAFWQTLLAALDTADWAPAFLHMQPMLEGGPVHRAIGRRADIVHRSVRASLQRGLGSTAYYETHVRKKKRKELGRLMSRLREIGTVQFDRQTSGDVSGWTNDYLTLEASGWKARAGTALGQQDHTRAFLHQALQGAADAGRLELIRMSVGDRPIAMLVNFLTAPGSFSFKIAYDEEFARFSPGVLIEIDNLKLIDRGDIDWMDSCAVADHNMINSLWAERRSMVRVTIPLSGAKRRATFALCRTAERGSALAKRLLGRG